MFSLGRLRFTVSSAPVTVLYDASAIPGSLAVGSTSVPTRATCPGPWTGADGVCPLFQLARLCQSPLDPFIQTAGTSWSLRNSMFPWATLTSVLLAPRLLPLSLAVLAYCQNVQG